MEALANGMIPQYADVQRLLFEFKSAEAKAQKADKRFLQRMRLAEDALERLMSNRQAMVAEDDWRPDLTGYSVGKRPTGTA